MGRCCICGNNTDANSGGILINGRTAPICNDCGEILDAVETMDQQDPQRKSLHSLLQGKMKESGATSSVIETVNEIFAGEAAENVKEFIESEKNEYEREKQEEKEVAAAGSGNSIESLCNFLSVFAVIFLVSGMIVSLIIGVPLTNYMPSSGWSIIIGGIIGTVLVFAMIMLVLCVSSAIGKINDKMDDTNDKIDNTNKQLSRIANMLSSSENHKQKK